MIIVNGTVQARINTGGGKDEQGKPLPPVPENWDNPIPCRIRTNKYSNKGISNGNSFTIASYEILIELQGFTAERVKLRRFGEYLGEFSVIQIEKLEAVQAVKIVV